MLDVIFSDGMINKLVANTNKRMQAKIELARGNRSLYYIYETTVL